MTTIYLIRHGEPDWGFKDERRLQGALRDYVPLTDNGIMQAEQVMINHKYLSDSDLIISSPFTRSLQTAAIINRNLALPIRVEFDLHEWVPDKWRANTIEEIAELVQDYKNHNGCTPEGEEKLWETKQNLITRTRNAIIKYMDKSKVIVVCHGMVISELMGIDHEEVPLCGVFKYEC